MEGKQALVEADSLGQLANALDDAILVIDGDLRIALANAVAAAWAGVEPALLAGQALADAPLWGSSPALLSSVRQVAHAGGCEQLLCRLPVVGRPADLEVRVLPGAALDQRRVLVVARDCTELRALRQSAEAHEARYRGLLDNIDDVIYEIAADGTLIYASPGVARYGWSPDEVLGRCYLEFVRAEDRERVARELAAVRATGVASGTVFGIVARDGSPYWVEAHGRPARDTRGVAGVAVGVLRDVTERRRQEDELRRQAQELRALASELVVSQEQERRSVAQDMHDGLCQTLVLAQLKLHALAGEAARVSADSLGEIGALLAQAEQQARLATRLVSPSMLYDLGLRPAAEWLAEEMGRAYGLTVRIGGSLTGGDTLSEATRVLVYRCLRELLVNVARHSGVLVAELDLSVVGSRLVARVSDRGRGVDLSRLAGQQVGGRFGLMGIGERLRHLGGELELRSGQGQGLAVTLSLPADG